MRSTSTNLTVTKCKESSSSSLDLPYLPDDILLNCIARVSRLYYPTLSLVSKRFRTLLVSLELYKTRTRLGCTESCLYLCLRSDVEPTRWYTLCRRPTQIPNTQNNIMVSVQTSNCQNHHFWGMFIAVGSNIYTIVHECKSSSRVFFMDCRSHTWHEAPSMQIARSILTVVVNVLDGKIFVMEGNRNPNSSYLIEVFDPITAKWEDFLSPGAEISQKYIIESLAINGNLYLHGDEDVVYKPKENKWEAVGWDMDLCLPLTPCCVIDNVLYNHDSVTSGKLQWFDFDANSWRFLKGLKELPKLPKGDNDSVRLVNYGGKLAVLWWEKEEGYNEKMIWFAEITLEKRKYKREEIFGKVEWCNIVLSVPKNKCAFQQFISFTVCT